MKGGRHLPAVAPHPGEDGGLLVCIDIPGLNRVASLERLWPLRVGRCEGPPHSYVRMPYGLPNAAATYQRLMRGIMEAQEARLRSPGGDGDGPRGATSASGASRGPWAWGLMRIGFRSPPSLLRQYSFVLNIIT